MYHYKAENITTPFHPHANRLKASLYYMRKKLDEQEAEETATQRVTDLTTLNLLRELRLKASEEQQTGIQEKPKISKKPIIVTKKVPVTPASKTAKVSDPKKGAKVQNPTASKDQQKPFLYLSNAAGQEDDIDDNPKGRLLSCRHHANRRDQDHPNHRVDC